MFIIIRIVFIHITLMVINTTIVEPFTTLQAGCGKAREVEVNMASWTVWILRQRHGVHGAEQITSFIGAGSSRERDGRF